MGCAYLGIEMLVLRLGARMRKPNQQEIGRKG
jgi:hypothetical protein